LIHRGSIGCPRRCQVVGYFDEERDIGGVRGSWARSDGVSGADVTMMGWRRNQRIQARAYLSRLGMPSLVEMAVSAATPLSPVIRTIATAKTGWSEGDDCGWVAGVIISRIDFTTAGNNCGISQAGSSVGRTFTMTVMAGNPRRAPDFQNGCR